MLIAIAGFHCRVPLWRALVVMVTNFGRLDVVPGCHCRVPLLGALQGAIVVCFGVDGGPTLAGWTCCLGAIAGCHCSSLWWGGRWWANFGGVDKAPGWHCRVPLWHALVVMVGQLWQIGRGIGAVAGCHCLVFWWGGDVAPGCHCTTVGEDDGGPTLADWTWHQGAIVLGYGRDGVCRCRGPLSCVTAGAM